jgi:hypothetical protein
MRFLTAPTAPVATVLPGSGTSGDILAYNNSLYCYLNGAWVALNNNTTAISDVTGLTAALSGKESTIAAGSTAQYWRGDKTWQSLDRSAVGLNLVDNTSDANKPVSTAQQAALNLKADLTGATFSGGVTFSSAVTISAGGTWSGNLANTSNSATAIGGTPPLQLGPTSGSNIFIDRANIQARSNGAIATLNLNALGGATALGGNLTVTGSIAGANFSGSSSGTNSGDQTITLTGDVTGSGTGSFAAVIGPNKVTFTKFIAATQAAFVGATSAGNFGELTPTQATAQLNVFAYSSGGAGTKGLVPATVVGDNTKFLRGDGAFALVDVSTSVTGYLAASSFPPLTGDVTTIGGSLVTAIGTNKVTLTNLAQISTGVFLGRASAGTGNVEALTGSQVSSALSIFGTGAKGVVPAPATVAGKVLSDAGTWISVAPAVANWTPVNATGTGSPQTITLPESTLTVNDVLVTVEGLIQGPSDYSISGATLTITAPNTADIYIRKLNAGSSGNPRSQAAGYITVDQSTFATTVVKGSNIASVTRTATGRYKVTFTTPLSNTNYGVNASGRFADANDSWECVVAIDRHTGFGFTTTAIDFECTTTATGSGGTLFDPLYFSFEIYDPSVVVSGGTSTVTQATIYRPFPFFFTSGPLASELLAQFSIVENITIPANFNGSVAHIGVNPTNPYVITLQQNGSVTIGTITIAANGTVTWATTGGTVQTLASGDWLTFTAQSSTDATISNVSITVKAVAS